MIISGPAAATTLSSDSTVLHKQQIDIALDQPIAVIPTTKIEITMTVPSTLNENIFQGLGERIVVFGKNFNQKTTKIFIGPTYCAVPAQIEYIDESKQVIVFVMPDLKKHLTSLKDKQHLLQAAYNPMHITNDIRAEKIYSSTEVTFTNLYGWDVTTRLWPGIKHQAPIPSLLLQAAISNDKLSSSSTISNNTTTVIKNTVSVDLLTDDDLMITDDSEIIIRTTTKKRDQEQELTGTESASKKTKLSEPINQESEHSYLEVDEDQICADIEQMYQEMKKSNNSVALEEPPLSPIILTKPYPSPIPPSPDSDDDDIIIIEVKDIKEFDSDEDDADLYHKVAPKKKKTIPNETNAEIERKRQIWSKAMSSFKI